MLQIYVTSLILILHVYWNEIWQFISMWIVWLISNRDNNVETFMIDWLCCMVNIIQKVSCFYWIICIVLFPAVTFKPRKRLEIGLEWGNQCSTKTVHWIFSDFPRVISAFVECSQGRVRQLETMKKTIRWNNEFGCRPDPILCRSFFFHFIFRTPVLRESPNRPLAQKEPHKTEPSHCVSVK